MGLWIVQFRNIGCVCLQDRDCGGEAADQLDVHLSLHISQGQ